MIGEKKQTFTQSIIFKIESILQYKFQSIRGTFFCYVRRLGHIWIPSSGTGFEDRKNGRLLWCSEAFETSNI